MAERVPRPPAMPEAIARHEALVLNKLATWVHACIDAQMAPEGLRARHYLAMSMVRNGHTGQQEIADKLNIDKATMVGIVNELEHRGYLGRERNPADKRHYRLWVTESGSAWIARADQLLSAAEDEMFSPLSAADRATLLRLMSALFEAP